MPARSDHRPAARRIPAAATAPAAAILFPAAPPIRLTGVFYLIRFSKLNLRSARCRSKGGGEIEGACHVDALWLCILILLGLRPAARGQDPAVVSRLGGKKGRSDTNGRERIVASCV